MTDTQVSAPPSLRSRVQRVAIRIGITYVGVVVVLAFLQRSLMYVPSRAERLPAAMVDIPSATVTDVAFRTDDGLELNAWEWSAADRPSESNETSPCCVLFFHGNGGDRRHRVEECLMLNQFGLDVISVDYRGYGDNPGSPSEEGLASDARAAWRFATEERGIAHHRILLFGESLGGGVAVRLASEVCQRGEFPAGLVLRSTFSSMTDAAAYHYPWLPVRLVLADRYPSIDRITDVTCPLLQIHGDVDRIVPMESGRRLFAAAPDMSRDGLAKRFVVLEGAGHNDVMQVDAGRIRESIRQFVDEIGQLR